MKVSSQAGIWAAFLLLIIFIIYQLKHIVIPTFDIEPLPEILIIPMAFGFGSGFLFFWFVRFLISTRLSGILTLILSLASISALFTYFFLETLKPIVLYCTLGIAIGILLHIILFPKSIKAFLESETSNNKKTG
jgi:hypothetical protein